MGKYGATMVAPNGSASGKFCAIQFVDSGTLTALTSDGPLNGTWTGITFPQGAMILGPFASVTAGAAARVIAYGDTRP